jgi:pimeloyl-ACP methyl ester carboxylesterase
MKKLIFIVLGSVLLSLNSFAGETPVPPLDPAPVCGTMPGQFGGPAWKYCVSTYADMSDDLMIFFHGNGGSETDWSDPANTLTRGILDGWRANGIQPPMVVAISFGEAWLLAEKNASPVSGLYEYFLGVVLPTIKAGIVKTPVDQTYLMGESMGGFNAAQIYLKQPALFSRYALICPAMSIVTPFATPEEIQDYVTTTGADPQLVGAVIQLAQAFLPTLADWNQSSPNVLVPLKLKADYPPVYVSNGEADPYGFASANKQFVQDVQAAGAPIQSNFYPGKGHCDVDTEAAALGLIPQ